MNATNATRRLVYRLFITSRARASRRRVVVMASGDAAARSRRRGSPRRRRRHPGPGRERRRAVHPLLDALVHPPELRRARPEIVRHLLRRRALLVQVLLRRGGGGFGLDHLRSQLVRLLALQIRPERAHDRVRRPRQRRDAAVRGARAKPHDTPRLARLVDRVQPRHERFLFQDGFELVQAERRDALKELAVQVVQRLVHLRVHAA
eukprot:30828-Pelagococcus_subviridis.AAC.12